MLKNEKSWILKTVYGKHLLNFSDFLIFLDRPYIFFSEHEFFYHETSPHGRQKMNLIFNLKKN